MLGTQLRCQRCNRYAPDRCVCGGREMPDKGLKGGSCNRQSCQVPGADHYNHSTKAYYCAGCASLINAANHAEARALFGHELCTREDIP